MYEGNMKLLNQSKKMLSGIKTCINLLPEACKGKFFLPIDYPINPKPRFGFGNPPHEKLYGIINGNRDEYSSIIESILSLKASFQKIPLGQLPTSTNPSWINGFLPGLDSIALYTMLATRKPKKYIEIGSGNSTKFARKAIVDHRLQTKIVSIDPFPRNEIDSICDEIIRKPLEEVDLEMFSELEANDVLFFDGSHRSFMNSDVTVFFLEILPNLNPGVLVQIHDILLPYDYFPGSEGHYFNEQYLLASYLLAGGNLFRTLFPCRFVSEDPELKNKLSSLWKDHNLSKIEKFGGSFWLEINESRC